MMYYLTIVTFPFILRLVFHLRPMYEIIIGKEKV